MWDDYESWFSCLWLGGAVATFLVALLADIVGWPWLRACAGMACVLCLVGFFVQAWRDSDR